MSLRRFLLVGLVGLGLLAGLSLSLPTAPTGAQPIFVTNTPPPPDVLRVTPDGRISDYRLRQWTQDDLLDVLQSQLARLARGETEQADAIRYTLLELEARFPGAPRDMARRTAIVGQMLTLEPGAVDPRTIIRPYLVDLFNRSLDVFPADNSVVEAAGWVLQPVGPLRLDDDDVADLLLIARYGDQYADWLPLIAGDDGYRLPPLPADLPAEPISGRVDLSEARDINADTRDEIVLRQDDGGVNGRLWILAYRNDRIETLTPPDAPVLIGNPDGGQVNTDGTISVIEFRLESARWNCTSQIPVTWIYRNNFYRRDVAYNAQYTRNDTVGCTLSTADPPLFLRRPGAATNYIAGVLAANSPSNPGWQQGALALATLHAMDGRVDAARDDLATIDTTGPAWLANQVNALSALLDADQMLTPLSVCDAILTAQPDGICDMDQVIERVLIDTPVNAGSEADLRAQLTARGLPVTEVTESRPVGLAPRLHVRFDLAGSSWWAFVLSENAFAIPQAASPPPGYVPPAPALDGPLPVPADAFALLTAGEPVAALTVLDNAILQADAPALSAEGRYFTGIALALSGDRDAARTAFYDLWAEAPASTWGALAGVHLSRLDDS